MTTEEQPFFNKIKERSESSVDYWKELCTLHTDHISTLKTKVVSLQKENRLLREALQFYADFGEKAKRALEQREES